MWRGTHVVLNLATASRCWAASLYEEPLMSKPRPSRKATVA